MERQRTAVLAGVAVLTLVGAARAQEPTAAPPPAAAAPSARPRALEREARFDLGVQYLAGVTDLRGLAGGLTLLRRSQRLEAILAAEADYLSANDRVLRRFAHAAATADLWPRDRWSPFAFSLWTKDEKAEVENRWQVGAGIKRLLTEGPRAKHSVSLALLWEDQQPTRSDLRRDESLFASLRFKDAWTVGNHSSLSSVVFFQPEVGDPGRYRAFGDLAFDTAITPALGLRLALRDEYDSRPLRSGIERNQVVGRLTLRYRRHDPTAGAAGGAP